MRFKINTRVNARIGAEGPMKHKKFPFLLILALIINCFPITGVFAATTDDVEFSSSDSVIDEVLTEALEENKPEFKDSEIANVKDPGDILIFNTSTGTKTISSSEADVFGDKTCSFELDSTGTSGVLTFNGLNQTGGSGSPFLVVDTYSSLTSLEIKTIKDSTITTSATDTSGIYNYKEDCKNIFTGDATLTINSGSGKSSIECIDMVVKGNINCTSGAMACVIAAGFEMLSGKLVCTNYGGGTVSCGILVSPETIYTCKIDGGEIITAGGDAGPAGGGINVSAGFYVVPVLTSPFEGGQVEVSGGKIIAKAGKAQNALGFGAGKVHISGGSIEASVADSYEATDLYAPMAKGVPPALAGGAAPEGISVEDGDIEPGNLMLVASPYADGSDYEDYDPSKISGLEYKWMKVSYASETTDTVVASPATGDATDFAGILIMMVAAFVGAGYCLRKKEF